MERTSPHAPLSSKDNKTIKYLASLSDAKHRKKEKAFLIEGVKMVEEALRDRAGVKMVVAAPSLMQHHGKGILKLADSRGTQVLWISERLMDLIAESKTPQPVMAVVGMPERNAEALLDHPSKLLVVCHQLQDPGNLGTIIRTAEAAGASGIAVSPHTVDPYNPKAVRATMGSILRLPVVPVGDAAGFLDQCRQKGFQTLALALNAQTPLFELDLKKPTVILVGQEGSGLPKEIASAADHVVRIPMAETVDSLNAAVSAAVVLYEAFRQRMGRTG